jgi:GcrA cell cycle regulator
MNPRFVWTPALDARLEELHASGMKFKQIAFTLNAEFKISLTRNAAIGRAHRIILTPRQPPVRKARPKRPARPKPVEAPPIAPETAPTPGALLMRHLTRHTCHWPEGDKPPYTYCGKPTCDGSSFCAVHYDRVYIKPRKEFS